VTPHATPLQEALWRVDQSGVPNPARKVLWAARILGPLDIVALERSWSQLVARHDILRTGLLYREPFPPREGNPGRVVQIVANDAPPTITVVRAAAPDLDSLRRPFDLAHPPLLRVALFELGPGESVLAVAAHPVVMDRGSLRILLAELGVLYAAFAAGREPELPPARQYSRFTPASRTSEKLRSPLPVVELPADKPRRERSLEPASVSCEIPSAPREVALAAFLVLLSRSTGEERLLVAAPVDTRDLVGFGGVAGPFENLVLLEADVSGEPSFSEVVQRARTALEKALVRAEAPLESIAPRLPAFQVMFDWLDEPWGTLHLPGLQVERMATEARCELTLSICRGRATIQYDAALFHAETAARILDRFRILLGEAIAGAERPAARLPLLSQEEQALLLVDWNRTEAGYPRDTLIHELFETQVKRTPGAAAVTFEGRTWTYRELNTRANQIARELKRRGAGPDTLVGIRLERSLEMVAAVMAVLKAGAAYVPLDPSYPPDRIAYMIEDSGMSVVIGADFVAADGNAENLPRGELSPENLAYVIYTSGSTGKPKGVQISHRALVNFLHSMRRDPGLDKQDALLAVTTLSFDIAGLELHLPLITGARIVLASREAASDGVKLAGLLAASGATMMQATPATWRLLLDAGWTGDPKLKILCGGEALSRTLADELLPRCGALWNMYGPTETTVWSTLHRVEAGENPIPLGRPIANTQVYVLDSHLMPVPIGVSGELWIGGDGLARGYLNRPELTAERFVFVGAAGKRLYRTGDLVRYRTNGELEFQGRIDHQVKIRGFRIELGEVESALVSHPQVAESVATAREDAPGSKRLVAYFVAAGAPPAPSDLRRHVREKLPEYMVPSVFVALDAIPRTPNGKVDRRALPAPEHERLETGVSYAPPRTDAERRLAALVEETLGVKSVGVRDDYFDLGAESLATARLFARIGKEFGRRIPPTTLFQAPTIEQLAKLLGGREQSAGPSCLVPIRPDGARPPLFCIHGGAGTVLFYQELFRRLDGDWPAYALQARGLYGGALPHRTVEEMAAQYLLEIRQVQPRGPYHLLGYCFGAIIAYEMAQRLTANGDEVALLVSLNGPAPRYRNAPPAAAERRSRGLRGRVFAGLQWRWQNALTAAQNKKRRMIWRLYEHYLSRSRPLPDRLRDSYFLATSYRAEWRYQPKPYAGDLVIYRARGLYRDPFLGWEGLPAGGIEVHDIPGIHRDHRDLMEEPAVGILAERLCQRLQTPNLGTKGQDLGSLASLAAPGLTRRGL